MRLIPFLVAAALTVSSLAASPAAADTETASSFSAAEGRPLLLTEVAPTGRADSNDMFLPVDPKPSVTPIPETADPSVAIPLFFRLLEAVEQGRYAVAVGLGLMLLTFLAVRIPQVRELVPKRFAATYLMGVGVLGSLGVALASGLPPGRAVFASIVCSALAIAFWESALKHVWDWMQPKIGPA